jgi:hypothetical protein
MAEFAKLREEVEKRGLAAKAAGQKHAPREEMCKLIMDYSASEAKWVKFTEAGVGACGIPTQIANQLRQVHANTEQTKESICTAGPAAGVPPIPLTGNDASVWLRSYRAAPAPPLVGDFWDFRPNGDGFFLRRQ